MPRLALILSDIRSTHNVGSILRSADGFGADHIFFAGYTPYPKYQGDTRLPHLSNKITNSIHKTALGAEGTMPFSIFSTIKEAVDKARREGYKIASIEQSKISIPLNQFEFVEDLALILGNEIEGVSRQTLETSDVILEIPMNGHKESFNVSVAAAIALYALKYGKVT